MVGRGDTLRSTSQVKTKEVLAMEVTTDDAHDSEAALINDVSRLRRVSEAVMDRAYDNTEAYRLLRV